MIKLRSLTLLYFLLLILIGVIQIPTSVLGQEVTAAEKIVHHNNRGVALLDQYKFKEAVEEFEAILAIDDGVMPAKVNLGIAYFYDQEYEEAQRILEEVLESDPTWVRAHYILGLIYRNQDAVEKAIEAFEAVHEADPTDPSTNYYLGRLYMRLRDYERAGDYFRTVIAEEPYNASAHYNLATALSRAGQRERGREEMEEFRRLQQLFGSTTVGLQYLEQGQYAIAIDNIPPRYLPGDFEEIEAQIPVRFAEVGRAAGLDFRHSGPGHDFSQVASSASFVDRVVSSVGSGLAFADYDQDGKVDLYLADVGSAGSSGALFRNRGDGSFENVTDAVGLKHSSHTMHVAWGDFDNDGFSDLYLVNYGENQLFRNQNGESFQNVTRETGTGDSAWGFQGGFVDFDHDGDLDIFVANFGPQEIPEIGDASFPEGWEGARNRLYRNNGDGTFEDVSRDSHLDGDEARTTSFISADFDNSRDVDFFLFHHGGPGHLLNNMRDGSFMPAEGVSVTIAGALGASAADINHDGLMDLVVASAEPGESRLLINQGNDRFEERDLPETLGGHAFTNVQFLDFDNDGDSDLLMASGGLMRMEEGLSPTRNFFLLRNDEGRFSDVSAETGLDTILGRAVRGVAVADYDTDGDLDIAVNVNGDQPLLLKNHGGNENNWFAIRVVGTNSNKSGIGVKAEVKAGRLWQKQEYFGGQGLMTQNSPYLHFGLGRHSRADVVRLIWPNGVLQSEIDREANQIVEIQELDRKGTSCPILYVWNGETYEFQTDFLGGSAYGSLLAPGEYNYPDTDEYIKLRRQDVAIRDGHVEITMNNQLEEAILFDQVQLAVVDHPSDFEIYPDEKLLPGPPYQPFRLFTAAAPRVPTAAVNEDGRSVLQEIRSIDRIYAPVPEGPPFKGYSDLQTLELDLGSFSDDHAFLLMHAWIDYADSTSNLAASQAGVKLIPPYLQVQNPEGEWVTVLERMGFPAGLPKDMTVDLSNRFLSDSRKIRIVTNMKIYWDQILVASGSPAHDFRLHRLDPSSAELRFRGFPRFASPDGRKPKVYFYDQEGAAEWKVHVGAYTKFGPVSPLLKSRDDKFVITRSGDEVLVRFAVDELPEIPQGWVRDYLVYVDGFGKDMDPNSAAPHFLGPLPFHGMSSFPYGPDESYPDSPEYREYLEQWNTRHYGSAVPELGESMSEE